MKSLLMTHPDCLNHTMPEHPERPERLSAVMELLGRSGLRDEMQVLEASEISNDQLCLTHPIEYIRHIENTENPGQVVHVDPDTYMSGGSTRAAKLAAGAVVEATSRILQGEAKRAFCAVRPPGHHAELAQALGFCLFNNIAIAAHIALQQPQINRVAILDFDVHHCNGTVDIFKNDERVLVCSSFQDHFYPYRYLDFTNDHIISTPLAAATGSLEFRQHVEKSWLLPIQQHKPDLIFVSAGFDAHRDDPLADLNLTENDFKWVTELIVDLANSHAGGRVISTLEGGYNLTSLANSTYAHVKTLLSG